MSPKEDWLAVLTSVCISMDFKVGYNILILILQSNTLW